VVYNNTAYVATLGNATAVNGTTPTGGATITVAAGKIASLWTDGTNFLGQNTVAGDATLAGVQTLTNKTIAFADNTLTGVASTAANTFTGLQTFAAGADLASAATINLTAATGNTVVITGTVATSALTMTAGQQMVLLPSGAWPMTYNATTMNINGGVSQTCAAGDRVTAVRDLAGVIRVTLVRQSGTAVVAAAGGAWTLLSTVTASASSTVDIEAFSSTYDAYKLVCSGITTSVNSQALMLKMKISGAYTTGFSYRGHRNNSASDSTIYVGVSFSGASEINLFTTLGDGATRGGDVCISLLNVNSTTDHKKITWEGAAINATGLVVMGFGAGAWVGAASALTGVRLYMNSGNIASGTFRLYGIAKS
jgi:hypothetical protein